MKISDAIENVDDGKKKGVAKKKKKGSRKTKDMDMLNVQEVDGDEDSWNSAREEAKHVDLSNAMPGMAAGDTPGSQYGAMGRSGKSAGKSSSKRSNQGMSMLPAINDTPAGKSHKAQGLSQNASAVQLSVQDELAKLDEAQDFSNQGSREDLARSSRDNLQR